MAYVTPDSFLSDTPPPRIIGSECEYNLQAGVEGGAALSLSAYMTDKALGGVPLKRVGQHLGNGSRLYEDVGHIEYAGPECLGPRQAAAADLAGIVVVQRMISASGLPHRGLYRLAGTYLNKGSANIGYTSGYHENYLLSRALSNNPLVDKFIPTHLASRIWAMGGTIRNGNFVFSQKVGGIGGTPIDRQYGRRTMAGMKPMALIPSESEDNDTLGNSQWARLEVRFADPLLSPLARYVGFAATSLVLRMIEHRDRIGEQRLRALQLINPVKAAKDFCSDLSLTQTAETVEGKLLTAMDIQEALATIAIELAEYVDLPHDEKVAAQLWLKISDRLKKCEPEEGQYGKLTGIIEAAARHDYLLGLFGDEDIYNETNQVHSANLAWDRILPEGPGQIWWKHLPSPITQEEINARITTAPPTRAAIRAAYINHYPADIASLNWAHIKFRNSQEISLLDPYESNV